MRTLLFLLSWVAFFAAIGQSPSFPFGEEITSNLWKKESKFRVESEAVVLGDFQLLSVDSRDDCSFTRKLRIKFLSGNLPNGGKLFIGEDTMEVFELVIYRRNEELRDGYKVKTFAQFSYKEKDLSFDGGRPYFDMTGRVGMHDILEVTYKTKIKTQSEMSWMMLEGFDIEFAELFVSCPFFYESDLIDPAAAVSQQAAKNSKGVFNFKGIEYLQEKNKVDYIVKKWTIGRFSNEKLLGKVGIKLQEGSYKRFLQIADPNGEKPKEELSWKTIGFNKINEKITEEPSFSFGSKDNKLLWLDTDNFLVDSELVGVGDLQVVTYTTEKNLELNRRMRLKAFVKPKEEIELRFSKDQLLSFEVNVHKRAMIRTDQVSKKSSNLLTYSIEDMESRGEELVFNLTKKFYDFDIIDIQYKQSVDDSLTWEGFEKLEFQVSEFVVKTPPYIEVGSKLLNNDIDTIGIAKISGLYKTDTLSANSLEEMTFEGAYKLHKWAVLKASNDINGSFELTVSDDKLQSFVDNIPVNKNRKEEEAKIASLKGTDFYKMYPDAPAIIHFDRAVNDLEEGKFSRETRIEILEKEGLRWGDFETKFVTSRPSARISNIEVKVSNLVGGEIEVSEMTKESIYKIEIDKVGHVYRFSAPNVRKGSIIDVSYTISDFYAYDWTFQETIPVAESAYKIIVPGYVNFSKELRGYVPIDFKQSYEIQNKVFDFVGEEIPPFITEPFLNSAENYKSGVSFVFTGYGLEGGVLSDWETVIGILSEENGFGYYLQPKRFVRDEVERLQAENLSSKELAIACYNYIRSSITWNKLTGIFATNEAKKVYEKGAGSVAEINLMLVSMLRYAGLSANPILLKTRDKGIMNFAMPRVPELNYLMVGLRIDGELLVLDATDKNRAWNTLPIRAMNTFGVMINETNKAREIVDIPSNQLSKVSIYAVAKLDNEGVITGTGQKSYQGYDGFEFRASIDSLESSVLSENITGLNTDVEISSYEYKVPEELSKSVKELFEFSAENQWVGDQLVVDPTIVYFAKENPFSQEERSYPISIPYAYDFSYSLALSIPDGMVVVSLPESESITLDMSEGKGSILALVKHQGNTLQLTTKVKLDCPILLPEEYDKIKSFYDHVIRKQSEKLVLTKLN